MLEVRLEGPETPVSEHLSAINAKLDRVLTHLADLSGSLARERIDRSRRYTRAETAVLLGVSARTVDRLLRRGKLAATRRDGHVRIAGSSISDLYKQERRSVVEVLPV